MDADPMAAKKKTGLGKGLSALIKDRPKKVASGEAGTTQLKLDQIRVNRYQPRTHFDQEKLNDLVASIKEHGVIQPLTVRQDADGYELIAGERRLRAAREAKLLKVPVHVIEADDQTALALALIENLQRDDLNPIEEALGYQQLKEEFSLTQDQIAKRVGKGRATITNSLRLLSLSGSCRELLAQKQISSGHAKVLLGLDSQFEQDDLAQRIAAEGLSVRQLEGIISGDEEPGVGDAPPNSPGAPKDPGSADIHETHIADLGNRLNQHFGTKVKLSSPRTFANDKKSPGKLEIEYYGDEDLQRLLDLFGLDAN